MHLIHYPTRHLDIVIAGKFTRCGLTPEWKTLHYIELQNQNSLYATCIQNPSQMLDYYGNFFKQLNNKTAKTKTMVY